MPKYVTLAEGNKHNRRSIADTVELLADHADFRAGDTATLHARPLLVYRSQSLVQLCIQFNNLTEETTFVVWLPCSARFKAAPVEQSVTCNFDTARLDNAAVGFDCRVQLATGELLRAVEIIPSALPFEMSDMEWQILICVIKHLKLMDLAIRTFGEELDPKIQANLPEIRGVDFQRLVGHEVPPLKVLQQILVDGGVGHVSLEKISNTLDKCGMRPVTPRRPARPRSTAPVRS